MTGPTQAGSKVILFLVNDCNYFVSHRLPVALACLKRGYQVHVAGPRSVSDEKIKALGFVLHELDVEGRSLNPFSAISSLLSIHRLYVSLRPDLVHHVAVKSVLLGGIVARWSKIPAVVNALTGLGYLFISQSIKTSIIRRLVMCGYWFGFNHPNCRVIFQNRDDAHLFISAGVAPANRVSIIRGSGVDVMEYVPREFTDGVPVVILPTRMLWDKGVAEFVEAAGMLQQEGTKARFVLVGDTYAANPATISREQLSAWHDSGVVEWWGHRNDMHEVYRQAHVVCLPSYREGLPKVLIEAAASGRPIVTTDVPGCREVVEDGTNGYIVPVKDSARLAARLKILVEDAELRGKMGAEGRRMIVNDFSVESVIAETLNCYQELFQWQQR